MFYHLLYYYIAIISYALKLHTEPWSNDQEESAISYMKPVEVQDFWIVYCRGTPWGQVNLAVRFRTGSVG